MRVQMVRLESKITDPSTMSRAAGFEADAARLSGKIRESKRLTDRSIDLYEQVGGPKGSLLYKALNEAYLAAWYYGDSTGAVRIMDEGLARNPIGKLSMSEAPYNRGPLAPGRTRSVLSLRESFVPAILNRCGWASSNIWGLPRRQHGSSRQNSEKVLSSVF